MIPPALLAFEILGLGVAIVAVLALIGAGVTLWLIPNDRWALLLAPAVGVGVLVLCFQVLTFVVPPHLVVIGVLALGAAMTVVTVLRRPAKPAVWELAGAFAISLAFLVALMQIVIQRGYYTLGGFPADNIFIYAQAGQYLTDHASPLLSGNGDPSSLGYYVVAVTGRSIPNSKGVFDAATSVLTGLPVYAVFDLVNALAISISIGPVWYFMRTGLASSWKVAALASLLMATNQMLYWAMGNGFQQESLATPVFTAGLVLWTTALRRRSPLVAALAASLGGSLVGLYYPIALIFVALAGACLVIHIIRGRDWLANIPWPTVLAAVAVGALAAAPVATVRLTSGLAIWPDLKGGGPAIGGVSSFPSLPFVLGDLPFAHRWEPMALPYTALEHLLLPLLVVGSVVVVSLMLLGTWRAIKGLRAPEASLLIAGLAIVLYEVAVANFAYGYVKALTYLVPFICAFIALGAATVARALTHQRDLTGWRMPVASAFVVVLIAGSALTSSDMVRGYLGNKPTLPGSYLSLSRVANDVPEGSTVYIENPAHTYSDLVKAATLAYFLPDRAVRIYSGTLREGTFPDQDTRARPCVYDYVISAHRPGAAFLLVDRHLGPNLRVYQRIGPRCSVS